MIRIRKGIIADIEDIMSCYDVARKYMRGTGIEDGFGCCLITVIAKEKDGFGCPSSQTRKMMGRRL